MALSQAKIDQLGKHLEQGQYANAEDMVTLKELVDYEVNTRRHQNYKITTEVPKQFGQFDTAKFINNLLGGLRVLNKNKFELVIQNWTFIRALYEIWRKIKKLMEYQEYTKYPDNAGCDGECRGLCSSCSSTCTGSGKAEVTNISDYGSGGQYYYRFPNKYGIGYTYVIPLGDGTYMQVDAQGNMTGNHVIGLPPGTETTTTPATVEQPNIVIDNTSI